MSATPKVYNPLSPFVVFHFKVTKDNSLAECLESEIRIHHPNICKYSANELIEMGAVYLDGKRCLKDLQLKPNQTVKAHLQPKRFPNIEKCTLENIIFQNSDFLILNKPSGVPIHATRDNYFENALERAKKISNQKLYVTHRLDTDTTGLLIFAKSPEVQEAFNTLFRSGQIVKIYRLISEKPLALGELLHYSDPEPSIPRRFAFEAKEPNWKPCRLIVLSSKQMEDQRYESLVQLITGRTHQIRGQLGLIKNPILGDKMYGSLINEDLKLECTQMDFTLNHQSFSFKVPVKFSWSHQAT